MYIGNYKKAIEISKSKRPDTSSSFKSDGITSNTALIIFVIFIMTIIFLIK